MVKYIDMTLAHYVMKIIVGILNMDIVAEEIATKIIESIDNECHKAAFLGFQDTAYDSAYNKLSELVMNHISKNRKKRLNKFIDNDEQL
jgi:hypothetical protein